MGFKWVAMGFKWLSLRGEWRIHAEKWVRSAKIAFSLMSTLEEGLRKSTFRQFSSMEAIAKHSPKTTIRQRF
jgi:hypothetical protein